MHVRPQRGERRGDRALPPSEAVARAAVDALAGLGPLEALLADLLILPAVVTLVGVPRRWMEQRLQAM